MRSSNDAVAGVHVTTDIALPAQLAQLGQPNGRVLGKDCLHCFDSYIAPRVFRLSNHGIEAIRTVSFDISIPARKHRG